MQKTRSHGGQQRIVNLAWNRFSRYYYRNSFVASRKALASMNAKELVMSSLVIEGHRDVYEQIYRKAIGEESPIRDAVAPRLIHDGINMTVYAISGDSYSHSQNTGRYLETALEQIDHFLEEAPRSE